MSTSELRIPASSGFVVVAKRAAAGFGCAYGFGVDEIDDLTIAVGEACENAISVLDDLDAAEGAQLRLSFQHHDGKLEVRLSSCWPPRKMGKSRSEPALGAQAFEDQRSYVEDRLGVHVSGDVARREEAADAMEMALRVMSLFVDDCRYQVDERTGGLRVRLTKYRMS